LSREFGTAVIIITHNLGVVARYADRVNVMYAGKVIETASATELYGNPKHPYTVGLLNSVPRLDETRKEKLVPIEGLPPDLAHLPPGCAFYPRCSWRTDQCKEEYPPFKLVAEKHFASCWESERVHREASVGAAG
jgi:oligopeptide transport system ATP-binding protein